LENELESRIRAFWLWIQHNSSALRSMILSAGVTRDAEAFNAAASAIYEQVAMVSEELVVDVHVGPDTVLVAIRTGRPSQALVHKILAAAPNIAGWRFAAEIPHDVNSIVARDQSGREVVVPYAALSFAISPARFDGQRHILIVFDGELDPDDGQAQQFFNDIAANVLTTFLGRIPTNIAYSLVPRGMATGQNLRPIFDLPTAWAEANLRE